MKKSTLFFLLLFLTVIFTESFAQDQKGNTWFFGDSDRAIRFTKPNNEPVLISKNTDLNTGGSAVASDPVTGKVLFYTDGVNVYDASHNLMPNGSGLGAAIDINQPVAISPVPGAANQYYIFSNNPESLITASIVDMSLPGNAGAGDPNLGEVIDKNDNSGALSTTDAMVVISGGDPKNYYLIIQDNQNLRSYDINNYPLSTPVQTLVDPQPIAKSFVLNEINSTMAIIPENPGINIKIYSYDGASGSFAVEDTIFNSGRPGETIYDGAWSSDGSSFFFSRNGATQGQIYVHYADSVAPQPVLTTPVYASYDLQLGPDGKMYHIYQEVQNGPYLIGHIENPNDPEALEYTPRVFDVDFNGTQFPQFLQQEDFQFDLVRFDVQDTCANNRTKFIPHVLPEPDSLVWTFGDTTFTANSPMLVFEAGELPISMTAYLNGYDSTYRDTITIAENELQISLPSNDTTVCKEIFPEFGGPGLTLTATADGGDNVQFFWSNNPNENNATGTFDSTGTYYVVAQASGGCTAYASVQVRICQEEKRVGNIWFFGDRAGIDFNPEEPTAIPDSSVMNAPAGTSTISDRNGEVLFYTDGSTVWNQQKEVMPNGTDIGGDPLATQSALIVPFPGDPTLYYIFTTGVDTGSGTEIRYSIVDIKAENTLGDVVLKGALLYGNSTEKITAVEAGGVTWLLIHDANNNFYRAYPITPEGIGAYEVSEIGSDHGSGAGYMKFSNDGSRVAAAVQGPPPFVELFDFDDSTGTLSDSIRIDFSGEQPYGIEFSPDNQKLYISTGSALYQYHINDTLTTEEVLASKKTIDTGGANLGALQLGPNGQIYLAQQGSSDVLVINSPNTLETDTSHVTINTFSLLSPDEPAALVSSGLGLPNFVQSIMEPTSEGGFEFTNGCLGDEIQFIATGRCDTDLFQWVIKNSDNQTIHSTTPTKTTELYYTFDNAGIYDVSLIISNPCTVPADTTISKDVEIFAPPADPGFPETLGICEGDTLLLTAGPASSSLTYYWVLDANRTDRTNNEISVWESGTYRVMITDTLTGCSATYDAIVEDAGPEVELGPDLFFCQGDEGTVFDLGNPGSTYLLEVVNKADRSVVRTSTRRIFSISTVTAGDFIYRATVTSPAPFNCATKDSLSVTINPAPEGTATGSTVAACGDTDGEITLNITSSGNYTFEVYDSGDNLLNSGSSPTADGIQAATGLSPGAYYVLVANENGCETRLNATVDSSDPNQFTITDIAPTQANCNDEGAVTVNLSGGAFPITYILNGTTEANDPINRPSPPGGEASNGFLIDLIAPGAYVLEVTDANGCVATTDIQIDPANEVPLEVDGILEQCVADINNIEPTEYAFAEVVNPNLTLYTYSWLNGSGTTTGIVGGTSDGAVKAFNMAGSYTVTASLISDPTCMFDTTIVVSFSTGPELEFAVGEDCLGERTVTVVASGSGSYNYLWSANAGGARTATVTVTTPGTHTYSVEVMDRVTGCVTEAFVEVTVNSEVTVSLSSSPACAGDAMITLFAETTPENVTLTWMDETGNILETGPNLDSIQVAEAGTYSVVVKRGNCEATDEIMVQRRPVGASTLPEANIIICPSSADPSRSEVFLDPDSLNAFTRYRWEVDEQFYSNEKIIRPTIAGSYRVVMTNIDGCLVEDEIKVVLSCEPVIFVPNAIRPTSGIGDNRTFRIFTRDQIAEEEFQVYIYNRWGELIFQSRNPNFQWDGTFNGTPVPMEKYTYTIYYKGEGDPSDEVYQLQGGVTVLR